MLPPMEQGSALGLPERDAAPKGRNGEGVKARFDLFRKHQRDRKPSYFRGGGRGFPLRGRVEGGRNKGVRT